ncbi:molybdenum cofactor guanylyltransferase [Seleniivibrio woodruffii]|uniref:molybdenum cofactor guanylyltransferase n=1 Tax=Seleniivibrio woodruffii TaxID=1078050 RepID=UPI0026E91F8E|nr:molybdenum cofactor guanylyltransferase [Seleniivibrio woodruffii]
MIRNTAIMAGGQSRRFNSDKTLEEVLGKKLIRHTLDGISEWADALVVVAKDCGKYSFLGVPCVTDLFEQQCPMVGILTALKFFDSHVFVVAADTPLVNSVHAEKLLAACRGRDAAVPVIDGKMHPLYAAYAPSLIPILEKQIADENYRLTTAFDLSNVVYLYESDILASENEKKSFININTKEDLEAAIDFMQGE